MLFTIPLVIFVAGYALALWCSATGPRLIRRFFFLPVLASLAITLFLSLRFEHNRLAPLVPSPTTSAPPDSPIHFLPLYALRLAPLVLGACLIVNAALRFAFAEARRRWRRLPPAAAAEG